MNYVTTRDGTRIFYKDQGRGVPVVFSHGWPLNADAWDPQMLYLLQQGYRVVAHDRRGHGRSSLLASGHDMDTYADDLAAVLETLNLRDVTLVGHATGGGEVARYVGRHGTRRVVKVVLISAIPPLVLRAGQHPAGTPVSVLDGLLHNTVHERARFFNALALPFYGYNRPGVTPDPGVIDTFRGMGMLVDLQAEHACLRVLCETDLTEDLKKFNVPSLIIHGGDDQVVPLSASAPLSSRLARNSMLKIYPGAPHGLCTTMAEEVSADLLAFLAD
jgi:non-heme chloroperoxidase